MQEKDNQIFEYTYSAKQQKEVEAIRKKYLPKGKMEEFHVYICNRHYTWNCRNFLSIIQKYNEKTERKNYPDAMDLRL